MQDCIRKVEELEMLFSDNRYDGRGQTAFAIEEGNIPVMVSAPHAVNHFRGGQIKWADIYTGGISKYLHEITGCHLIYSCMFTESDPNYDEPETNQYQNALAKYVREYNIMLLMDLHGASQKREYAVELGTAPEPNQISGKRYEEDPSLQQYKFVDDVMKKILEERFCTLSMEQKQVWKNVLFSAGSQNTVTKYVSENTDAACIQLEINGHYRNPQNTEAFMGLIEALTRIIQTFSILNWKSNPSEIWEKV